MKFVRDTDYKLRNVDCIKSIEEIFTTAPNGYIAAEPGETRDYKAEAGASSTNRGAVNGIGYPECLLLGAKRTSKGHCRDFAV